MTQLKFQAIGVSAEDLFSVAEVAKILGHKPQWIYRRIYSGQLSSEMIGGRHVVRGADIIRYLDGQISYGPVELAPSDSQPMANTCLNHAPE